MENIKQHDHRTTRRPDCVTEIRMGNTVLVVSGFFKKDTTSTAADNHNFRIFNRGNGINNAMNTGDRNTQRSENRSRFRCVIIPGLRYARERNKYRRTATLQLFSNQRQRVFQPGFTRQRRVTQ